MVLIFKNVFSETAHNYMYVRMTGNFVSSSWLWNTITCTLIYINLKRRIWNMKLFESNYNLSPLLHWIYTRKVSNYQIMRNSLLINTNIGDDFYDICILAFSNKVNKHCFTLVRLTLWEQKHSRKLYSLLSTVESSTYIIY